MKEVEQIVAERREKNKRQSTSGDCDVLIALNKVDLLDLVILMLCRPWCRTSLAVDIMPRAITIIGEKVWHFSH